MAGRFIDKYPNTNFHELDLSWIIDTVKKLGIDVSDLEAQLKDYEDDVNAQLETINNWINNYSDEWAKSVIQKYLATMIFPEITDAGYIVYNIPDTWDEITFNTVGVDITIPGIEYGTLVLSY